MTNSLWKSTRRWLPGLLISLAAIAVMLYFVDLERFVDAIRSANFMLLLVVLALAFVWLGVRGIVWRTILKGQAKFRDVFLSLCEGYLLNNFLPFRMGEIGKVFLLSRKSGLGFMEILPTVIIERILDLVYAATILLIAVPFVVGASGTGRIALIIGIVMVIGLVALFLLARNRERGLDLFRRLSTRWPGLQTQGVKFLDSLFSGLSILTDGWLFARVLLWMTLNWAIAIFQYYILILAFFPHATPLWALFGQGAVALGNAIPSLPGALGTFEGAFVGAITLLSGDQSTALAAALTSHLVNYLSTGFIGLYGLSNEGETLMGIYRQLRRKEVV